MAVGMKFLPAHIIGVAESGGHIADVDFGGSGQVGAVGGMHHYRVGQGFGYAGDRGQRFVIDFD